MDWLTREAFAIEDSTPISDIPFDLDPFGLEDWKADPVTVMYNIEKRYQQWLENKKE